MKSLIISTSNGRQVTVGALLTVPGNGKEYSAVATVFAGALQAVRGDVVHILHRNMAVLLLLFLLLLLLLLLFVLLLLFRVIIIIVIIIIVIVVVYHVKLLLFPHPWFCDTTPKKKTPLGSGNGSYLPFLVNSTRIPDRL